MFGINPANVLCTSCLDWFEFKGDRVQALKDGDLLEADVEQPYLGVCPGCQERHRAEARPFPRPEETPRSLRWRALKLREWDCELSQDEAIARVLEMEFDPQRERDPGFRAWLLDSSRN